jgi:hypothetical protein
MKHHYCLFESREKHLAQHEGKYTSEGRWRAGAAVPALVEEASRGLGERAGEGGCSCHHLCIPKQLPALFNFISINNMVPPRKKVKRKQAQLINLNNTYYSTQYTKILFKSI